MEPQYKQPKQPAVRCPDAGRARRRQHRHIQGSAEELQACINCMGIYILKFSIADGIKRVSNPTQSLKGAVRPEVKQCKR